ncbi:MAG: hypothetical protein J6B79_00985 [Clostridia bacterium]|nr:hypothetical protein [Clostridia bacterium]
MRKKFLIFAICFMLITTLFSGVGFAYASQTNEPVAIRPLCSPTSVAVSEDGYFVLDEGGLLVIKDGQSTTYNFNASEITSNGDKNYAIIEGEVFSFSVSDKINLYKFADVTGATHIAATSDKLFVAKGEVLWSYSLSGEILSALPVNASIDCVTATENAVFYSVSEGVRSSVYDGKGNIVYPLVRAKKFVATQNQLFGLTREGEIVRVTNEGTTVYYDASFVECAYATGGDLVIVTEQGEIKRIDSEGACTLVGASASDYEGFYNHPVDAVARLGQLFVADYLNDRVVVTKGKGSTKYLPVARPLAVSVDNNGYIYVAHSSSKVTRFTPELTETSVSYDFDHTVTAITISADNSVYALSGDTVYLLSEDKTKVKTQVDAFDYSSKLVYARENQAFDGEGKLLFAVTGNIIDIRLDASGAVFALVNDGGSTNLVRYDGNLKTMLSLSTDACSLFLSKTETATPLGENIGYGDLLVCHKRVSQVEVYEGESVGITDTPNYIPTPEVYDGESIVRTLLYDGYLYPAINETAPVMRVSKNTKVLVLKYDIPSHAGVAYCATENLTGELTYGYLFKSSLSAPDVYRQPPENSAVVYASGVSMYFLPSLSAEKIKALPVGENITLMTFALYSSIDGNEWYRAQHSDGTTGYVPSDSVSIRNFIPGDIRPQYNGEIISYNGSIYAPAYIQADDGSMVRLGEEMLFTGDKVEIIGNFDTSQKWTQIKYFDEELGTLTCYVETVFLKYNSVSVVQIVAIVVAVVTFILLVLLLIRMYLRHRKI